MTNCWTPNGNRVASMAPGPDDLFVVTTILAKTVFIQPVADYERAFKIAEAFARHMTMKRPFAIKVIPMSLDEMLAHIGMTREEFAKGLPIDDIAARKLVVDTCMEALRDCADPAVRADALDLLTSLGVVQK